MTPGFLFGLVGLLFGFGLGLDMLITRWGMWNNGLIESNPIYKIYPQFLKKFVFETAFGSFLDGGLKVILGGVLAGIFYSLGYGREDGSYLDSLILGLPAVAVYGLNVRNLLLIRKFKAKK